MELTIAATAYEFTDSKPFASWTDKTLLLTPPWVHKLEIAAGSPAAENGG